MKKYNDLGLRFNIKRSKLKALINYYGIRGDRVNEHETFKLLCKYDKMADHVLNARLWMTDPTFMQNLEEAKRKIKELKNNKKQ